MIEIKLPFWLSGEQLSKLRQAAANWWDTVETWVYWPLTQFDPLTCSEGLLKLLAWQRDIKRFNTEPLDMFRKRVAFAYVNAQDAGSTAGFIRIAERIGIGYMEIEERFDQVNWDVVRLYLSDQQISENPDLIQNLIEQYGRTCRRYELITITPVGLTVSAQDVSNMYYYNAAKI